jgi:hypothetical protein
VPHSSQKAPVDLSEQDCCVERISIKNMSADENDSVYNLPIEEPARRWANDVFGINYHDKRLRHAGACASCF